ncbi:MAG TPA: hypothetical protein VL092_11900 [Chitinophagaceae bacterium]|nr:hypothetical protein [Chitinophagaceae bacterium]
MTYDIYSVSGQGTGGSFRPLRNGAGSVFDPLTESETSDKSHNGEVGLGWNFSLGYDKNSSTTNVHSGPWKDHRSSFSAPAIGSIYENVYFKQGGELTQGGASGKRAARSNLLYFFNGDEATKYGVATDSAIRSYNSSNGFADGYAGSDKKDYISRVDRDSKIGKKPHHISEVVQVQSNGKKYIYGIPAMNNIQKEVTFAVNGPGSAEDQAMGLVPYSKGSDDTKGNLNAIDHFYSANITSSYAHSYLLSAVLSVDYADVTGDGPSDDDLGTYTKFNYTRKESDYRWRAPITEGKAQYSPGFISDKKDDKGSYLIGSREQWMLHSIETKNFIAEFYTSPRLNGKGVKDMIDAEGFDTPPYNSELGAAGSSYKLDSIKLFNKHDRFINKTAAVPVKTVYLTYDYSLCKKVPNKDASAPDTLGKLTLKKIFVKYGNSEKSLLSPYQFTYSSFNPDYNLANKDRWGGFKPNKAELNNNEYPYVDQSSDSLDIYASAWSLKTIQLPSGGVIDVDYEADDYAYVQGMDAAEMYVIQGVGMSKYYMQSDVLFINKTMPNLFSYFKRRNNAENRGLPFKSRYFRGQNLMYYNFNLSIVPGRYEPIKGYAEVKDIGICPNDTNYGYVMMKPVVLAGGGGIAHPATGTGLNIGRYNLSHLVFPGSDPDESDISNILWGLFDGIKGLITFMKNPLSRLMENNQGKYVQIEKSFIRLSNPNGHKVGGGHRVKAMRFYDNWAALAGGDAQNATYGKTYDYTAGGASSGVASYEPQIGGDENPYKSPIPYKVQNASNFPPSDPIELYQEMPLGETFFPPASVGYGTVTVSSIHREVGRSAQGQDIHQFYTARDFPVRVGESSLTELKKETKYKFKEQSVVLHVQQSFSVTLNDMHGKMKRVEHRVLLPENGKYRVISYQDYKYNGLGAAVPVLSFDGSAYVPESKVLGQESDYTTDAREKIETTRNSAFFFSSNGFMAGPFPIYIPVPVNWSGNYRNEFKSVVSTSVTQQYGILMEVQSMDEGAITTVRNEVFDPNTGQPLITSVNNEFEDREYSLTMPAYWAYNAMGPSYTNIGYTEHFSYLSAVTDLYHTGSMFRLPITSTNFRTGDEVLIRERAPGGKVFTGWVMPIDTSMNNYFFQRTDPTHIKMCLTPIIKIRNAASPYTAGLTGGVSNVDVKVIRSGMKNQLNESIQTVTALDPVTDGSGRIKSKFTKVINLTAQEFSDSLYAKLDRPEHDTVNSYLNGDFGVYRLAKEHVYLTNRDYKGSGVRKAGLFDATSFWQIVPNTPWACREIQVTNNLVELPRDLYPGAPYYQPSYLGQLMANALLMTSRRTLLPSPLLDRNWKQARSITKWTPWGFEAENVDALGIYSSALYRYNQMQPVAVAQNARQKELLNDNFEDYSLLQVLTSWIPYEYSPFVSEFGSMLDLAGSPYGYLDVNAGSARVSIVNDVAHSGKHSMLIRTGGGSSFSFSVPVVDTANLLKMEQSKIIGDKDYILSYWFRPQTVVNGTTEYALPAFATISSGHKYIMRKSNIIDGWQQIEVRFKAPPAPGGISIALPAGAYIDDLRFYPADANMKSFVYNYLTQKLMATLDENNYATFYEYDQEGNLIRTKRETERGIITLSESRSANPKATLN